MLRTLFCTAVALALLANVGLAGDDAKQQKKKKKNAAPIGGTVAKVDAEKGLLTLKIQINKKQTIDKDYKLTDKTTVTAVEGEKRTELKGPVAELLRKEQFKTGTTASVEAESDGNTAKAVTLGEAPMQKKKKIK